MSTSTKSSGGAPVLIDMGKQPQKAVRNLKKGTGKLLDEIVQTVDELTSSGTVSKNAQLVIVCVSEKPELPKLSIPFPVAFGSSDDEDDD